MRVTSTNLCAMQAHLFGLLRPLLARHTEIRDLLGQSRAGDLPAFERVLAMVEDVTAEALWQRAGAAVAAPADAQGVAADGAAADGAAADGAPVATASNDDPGDDPGEGSGSPSPSPSSDAYAAYRRAWWLCQPQVRPLPDEAIRKGAMQISKKDQRRAEGAQRQAGQLADPPGLDPSVPVSDLVAPSPAAA